MSGTMARRGTRILCSCQKQTTRASMHSLCVSVQECRAATPPLAHGRLEFPVRHYSLHIDGGLESVNHL
ncbi:hypothetical protein Y032_0100g3286 [Ancylostoma ceylanicum]|uniref:Uncharacterized protein n=1 Tax=Ancylostoma ceylanicum TaxID=53326 RepID=A0A016TIK5_9BILA|nr:hypothetical protein Y032_0100g3286 [Ancylostoma ceylanicum]